MVGGRRPAGCGARGRSRHVARTYIPTYARGSVSVGVSCRFQRSVRLSVTRLTKDFKTKLRSKQQGQDLTKLKSSKDPCRGLMATGSLECAFYSTATQHHVCQSSEDYERMKHKHKHPGGSISNYYHVISKHRMGGIHRN